MSAIWAKIVQLIEQKSIQSLPAVLAIRAQ